MGVIVSHQTNPWLTSVKQTATGTKEFLSNLSIKVRTDQYKVFIKLLQPQKDDLILDTGASSIEMYKDSNMLEKLYPYSKNITAATIENADNLQKLYPKLTAVQIKPGKKLPFKRNQFNIVTSWATLEHVGGEKAQKFFLSELARVGKKVFLTTPYKYCFYEPHSGVFFLHWLPDKWFRKILQILGKNFWVTEDNLRPLGLKDVKMILPDQNFQVKIYFTLGLLPTHLIIFRKD